MVVHIWADSTWRRQEEQRNEREMKEWKDLGKWREDFHKIHDCNLISLSIYTLYICLRCLLLAKNHVFRHNKSVLLAYFWIDLAESLPEIKLTLYYASCQNFNLIFCLDCKKQSWPTKHFFCLDCIVWKTHFRSLKSDNKRTVSI